VRSFLPITGLTALALALSACGANTGGIPSAGGQSSVAPAQRGGAYAYSANVVRACPAVYGPNIAQCQALVRTDVGGGPDISGLVPSDLQSAYNLPSAKAGKGEVVAVVDAFDDPNAESDLAVYRKQFGLPACNKKNPCFEKVNEQGQQSNYPQGSSSWGVEESLDVDMVSAICPNCKIILVEGTTNNFVDLGTSVNTAVNILHADVVSNSYIGYNDKSLGGSAFYRHPGHVIVAAAGDEGYKVGEPAGFDDVVAVGGTALSTSSGSRGWSETAWAGTGSGCVLRHHKPAWQHDKGCKFRTMNDVSAVASPATGVAIYDTFDRGGWSVIGGTSAASPIIGAVYALAGNASSQHGGESLYAKGASLFDVTSGTNGSCKHKELCTGGPGYDGPTGNGTPNGVTAF
jgi:subtilase family serine protease